MEHIYAGLDVDVVGDGMRTTASKKPTYTIPVGFPAHTQWSTIDGTYVGYGCVGGIGINSGVVRVCPLSGIGNHFGFKRALTDEELHEVRRRLFKKYGPDWEIDVKTVEGALETESFDA